MKKRNVFMAAVVVLVLGVALQQLLSGLTEGERVASVQRLEKTIAEVQQRLPSASAPSPHARPQTATPPEDFETYNTCDAWEALFRVVLSREEELLSAVELAIEIAHDIGHSEKGRETATDAELEILREFVEGNADIIDQIRDVAVGTIPLCRFGGPNHHHQATSYDKCALWLSADMFYRYAVREFPETVRDLTALCRLSRNTFFIEYYGFGNGQRLVAEALESGLVDDACWQDLLDVLALCSGHQAFVDKWTYITQDCIDWYENPPSEFTEDHAGHPFAIVLGVGYRYGATPLRNYHSTWFNGVMGDLLPLTSLPFYQVEPKLPAIREEFDIRRMRDLPWVHQNLGTWVVSILFYDAFARQAYSEAELDLTRFAILLDRYHRAHGSYPTTLEAFADDFGGELPINPILGEPYGYLRNDESFRLWYEYIARPDDIPAGRRAVVWPGRRETIGPADPE